MFGEATAHAAAAAGTIANASIPQKGDTELGYALRLAAATRELTPPAAELLGVLYRLHTRENLRQQIIDAEELAAGRRSDVIEISVGFCDLVGFTRLGEGVPAADLGAIATRLAALAADVAEPPVRLVKTLGDAVMFVAPEPPPLLDAALGLMEAAAGRGGELPRRPRGRRPRHRDAALGRLLRRAGQPRGAARRARAARLAAHRRGESDDHAADDAAFAWSPAGAKRLKGMSEATRGVPAATADAGVATARMPCRRCRSGRRSPAPSSDRAGSRAASRPPRPCRACARRARRGCRSRRRSRSSRTVEARGACVATSARNAA